MGENRSELLVGVTQNGQVKSAELVQAKRKRMMLAEVYVHKSRKMDADANKEDHFDVFHIYEFDDNDSLTKITPKLSTNCTEPRKIIDVLQNSTGSDTPQLQRLIEKLCSQNKKWTENQNGKNTTSNAAQVNNGNKTTPVDSNAKTARPAATATYGAPVATPPTAPMIRVKTVESMNQSTNLPKNLNAPLVANQPPPLQISNQLSSVQRSLPPIRPSSIPKNGNESEKEPAGNKANSGNPVKLWNNVMQKNNTGKSLDYLKVVMSNKEDTNTDESVFCLKQSEDLIEHATENSSTLKIGQVFECVSDEFVEDLLVDKRPNSTSPLLDNLVKEVVDNHNRSAPSPKTITTNKSASTIKFVPSSSRDNCTDYRCNICLDFNDTYDQYKSHMRIKHQYNFICENCRDCFRTRRSFDLHLNQATNLCVEAENSKRNFICIVDPPVILMKNNKVFAFRCKHCSIAFQNQRNYVQHSQRHAKTFRCKLCPSLKPMSSSAMQIHLNQH